MYVLGTEWIGIGCLVETDFMWRICFDFYAPEPDFMEAKSGDRQLQNLITFHLTFTCSKSITLWCFYC